jgi:NADH-quinone oxidoreductase subunit D
VTTESPRGELGAYLVSDGGSSPYRMHMRDPSFVNMQSLSVMARGGLVADLIAIIASLDPIMGGVDR